MIVKRNIVANFIGQSWRAIMSLAFVPVYIRYLGAEAYGLIGVFALLQVSLTLLDLGMKPALSREMAKFKAGVLGNQEICDLLRSIEIIILMLAVVAMLGIYFMAEWLAFDWLNLKSLSAKEVIEAVRLMGFVCVIRFVENVYTSSISGLQEQSLQNIISSTISTVQAVGLIYVLMYVSPTIHAFFVWQALLAVLSLAICKTVMRRLLPIPGRAPKFSLDALLGIWRFSGGVMITLLLATLVTQLDKVLLSRILTLEDFGYYVFASSVASSLYMLASPITQAFYPRFSELIAHKDVATLSKSFHVGTQLLVVVMGSAAVWLAYFSSQFINIWTGDSILASNVAPLLSVLAVGTLLNGLIWMPSQVQLAYGWTKLGIYENIIGILVLAPLMILAVPRYGSIAAAWVWVILNVGYLVIGTQFMFKKFLTQEKSVWYRQDVALPLFVMAIAGGFIAQTQIENFSLTSKAMFLVGAGLAVLVLGALAASLLRGYIASSYRRLKCQILDCH